MHLAFFNRPVNSFLVANKNLDRLCIEQERGDNRK